MTHPTLPTEVLEKMKTTARKILLEYLDVEYKEYTPDQGMPAIVYELNDAQLDYLTESIAEQAVVAREREILQALTEQAQQCLPEELNGAKMSYNRLDIETIARVLKH